MFEIVKAAHWAAFTASIIQDKACEWKRKGKVHEDNRDYWKL